MKKILVVESEKCAGCRSCELACSAVHHRTFDPNFGGIHVQLNETTCLSIPVACLQCDPAPCMEVCPVEALYRSEEMNAVLWDQEACIGCGLCMKACPIGAIKFKKNEKKVMKCDLCGGEPECIQVCPNHAITFVEATEENLKLRAKQIALYKEVGIDRSTKKEVE